MSFYPGKLGTFLSGAFETQMWKAAQIPTQDRDVYQFRNIVKVLREENDNGSLHFILQARSLHLWAKDEVKKNQRKKIIMLALSFFPLQKISCKEL